MTSEIIVNHTLFEPGSIVLHFTDIVPSVKCVNNYMEAGIQKVIWIQPNQHMQKEIYDQLALFPLYAQHACFPHWIQNSIDNLLLSEQAYIEYERIRAVSAVNVKDAKNVFSIMSGMKHTLASNPEIKNIYIANDPALADVISVLEKYGFIQSISDSNVIQLAR